MKRHMPAFNSDGSQPLVSIGLVAYNRGTLIGRAIESVLSQDYPNIELVISDDASKDDTESICLKYSQNDSRVCYIRQQKNIGMTANFVEVFKQSSGTFFMWLSDDDWLESNYVSLCLEYLKTHSDYSLACGKTRFFENGHLTSRDETINLTQRSASQRVISYYSQVDSNVVLYGLMRREHVEKTVYRNTFGADLLISASLAFLGKMMTLEGTHFNYSVGGVSMDTKKLALYYGFSPTQARHPYRVLMMTSFQDIFSRSPAYASCNKVSRFILALRAASVIRTRFTLPKWEAALRANLRLGTRLRSVSKLVSKLKDRIKAGKE